MHCFIIKEMTKDYNNNLLPSQPSGERLNKKVIALTGLSVLVPTVTEASGNQSGRAGGGGSNPNTYNVTTVNAGTPGAYGFGAGSTFNTYTAGGAYSTTVSVVGGSSTPFLSVWNGEKFVHENDFLFGKPNTAFSNHKVGLKAYNKGIGGDTYLLSQAIQADENGELKLQISELEPEESYIDKFELCALDLKPNEHFITDGNLEDSYIFNTEDTAAVSEQVMYQYHYQQNTFTTTKSSYSSITPQAGKSITLQSGDELMIRIPRTSLNPDKDTFLLVDSHFRDWSLGNQVPFSRLEQFAIQSYALSRSGLTTLAGVALLASAAVLGINSKDANSIQKLVGVPYTYADVGFQRPPVDLGGWGCTYFSWINWGSGDYSMWLDWCRANYGGGGGGGGGGKSLVIFAGDSFSQTHLQTLFPRYVQASQEVVRIPKEILANLKDTYLTLRIKATKKHKVRAAFAFQGTPTNPELKPLTITKASDLKDQTDYTDLLKQKDGTFLHTIPGSKIALTLKTTPAVAGTVRRYVLKANGFYTRMSNKTALKIGKNWLDRLAPEDRKLLKHLRLS